MRVLVAGATGVIGAPLVEALLADRHTVFGVTRTVEGAERLTGAGATAIVCDVFDASILVAAVADAEPDVVIHQLTDLPDERLLAGRHAEANARMRREGTRNLLRAAREAGAERVLAQSVAWDLQGDSARAVRDLERAVLAYPGVVLRYGQFYGPGTYWSDGLPPEPRVQVERAVRETISALLMPPQIVRIVDE